MASLSSSFRFGELDTLSHSFFLSPGLWARGFPLARSLALSLSLSLSVSLSLLDTSPMYPPKVHDAFMNAMMPNGRGSRLDRTGLVAQRNVCVSVYHRGK